MLTSPNSEESHRHLELEQINNKIGVMTKDISEMKKYYKAMNSQLKTVNRNFKIFSESQQGQRIHMPNGLNINQYSPPINKINKNIVFFQCRSFWQTILRKM
jgi:hypothetical protein